MDIKKVQINWSIKKLDAHIQFIRARSSFGKTGIIDGFWEKISDDISEINSDGCGDYAKRIEEEKIKSLQSLQKVIGETNGNEILVDNALSELRNLLNDFVKS